MNDPVESPKTTQYKITCKNYPSEFNLDKTIAKEYFHQFGKLKRVIFKPKIRTCTVEYATKEGFSRALHNAGEYKGNMFEVSEDKPTQIKEKQRLIAGADSWRKNDEIQQELKAMSAVGEQTLWSHPDNTSADSLSKHERKKKTKVWNVEASVKKKHKIKAAHKDTTKRVALSQEHLSLINLILSQSQTLEDKCKVLDARDKLLRLKLKQRNVTKSVATLGTCPDMCPEKERLIREIQHQISIYEQDFGKVVNHNKLIKQYSRSSADQEAPLAHELRPVPTLQMTMCYLMHSILDLIDTPDVNLSEWFHFLWDRTRSIRKDITQQELCCEGAVELVEQCARFHIHCSARLVAEDPSVFDQKINTENLTKCLQTLKYMYHDLDLKGEHCPNEAEFRAYVILLNLNDGNFLWEVQQFREEIQKSPEVKFAMEVYSALDKNNYVKFFKLLKSTSYLNACILMRYFVQLRTTALKFLVKCYAPRATKTLYPLSELTDILCFDDIESTIHFMQSYGLSLNNENTHIILDKSVFTIPDIPYVLDRSLNVVESKRCFSVGRVVCGKDLPPRYFEKHVLQNSFDAKGYLISRDFLEEDDLEQASKQLTEELEASKELIADLEDSDEVDSTNEKDTMRSPLVMQAEAIKPNIFASSIMKLQQNPSESKKDIFQQPFITSITTTGNIFGNVKQSFPGTTVQEEMDTTAPADQSSGEKVEKEYPTIFRSGLGGGSTNIFVSAAPENVESTRSKSTPTKGGFSFNLVKSSNTREPDTAVSLKSPSLSKVSPIRNDNVMSAFFQTPKITVGKDSVLSSDTKAEKCLENAVKLSSEIKSGAGSQKINIVSDILVKIGEESQERTDKTAVKTRREEEDRKIVDTKRRKSKSSTEDIKTVVAQTVDSILSKVEDDIFQEKIDLLKRKIFNRKMLKIIKTWRKNILLKRKRKAMDCTPVWVNSNTSIQAANELHCSSENITLSLRKRYKYGKPLDIEIEEDEKITKINLFELTYSAIKSRYLTETGKIHKAIFWKVVISMPDEQEFLYGAQRIENIMEDAFQWRSNKHIVEQVKINSVHSITYCVEKHKGLDVVSSDANGIIFIAKTFNTVLQKRIFEHLKEFGVFTKVPIVIILQEYVENDCKLKALQDAKILSDYVILIDPMTPHTLLNSVEEALVFLAGKVEMPSPLELDTFSSFLKKYLCSEIWRKANSFAKWNLHYKTCLQDPNVVIKLYNEGLSKLTKIILDKSSKEYANFPEFFKDYLASKIPDYLPCQYQYFPSFWKSDFYIYNLEKLLKKMSLPQWTENWPPSTEFELEMSVAKYCNKAFKNNPEKTFYKIMGLFLQNIDPSVNFKDIESLLWTNVVELLGIEKMNELSLDFSGTEFANKSVYHQYVVVYNKNSLERYYNSDWFYINNPMIEKRVKQLLQSDKTEAVEEIDSPTTSLADMNKIIEEVTQKLVKRRSSSEILKVQEDIKDVQTLLDDLETSIIIHKKISTKVENELKQAILDN